MTDQIRSVFHKRFVTDTEMAHLLGGSKNRRYGLIKRAMAKQELLQARRGLYVLSEKYSCQPLNLFELAQFIYGPSYISFSSALSYHGLIPEAVYTTTCACEKQSKEFKTPMGGFVYTAVPANPFFSGVRHIKGPNGNFFMAEPWTALADYVYAHKKEWKGIEPLIQSLRIEESALFNLDGAVLQELENRTRSRRVIKFLKGVRKDLRL